ncbi:MAG: DUF2842 domain-containing protein [Alphaproteobacteria bacterium]|nr:MAG: DUF2842 domain-containing protein [Alphaproteobacteria bacterium]
MRKALGALILIGGLIAYCVAVAEIGAHLVGMHLAIQTVFYVVAGILWVWPAARVVRWAQR